MKHCTAERRAEEMEGEPEELKIKLGVGFI